MKRLLNHSRLRDARFVGFVLVNLFLISGFLVSGSGGGNGPLGGWRRVDVATLQLRIDAGDLVDREARWYHRAGDKGGDGL